MRRRAASLTLGIELSYAGPLVFRPTLLLAWIRVAPLVALSASCVVSFNDYPVGDLHGTSSKAGEANGGGSSGGRASEAGTGNDGASPESGSGGGGAVAGTGALGGSSGGGGAGSGGGGGSGAVGMAGEAGVGNEAGAPGVAPTTVEITDLVDSYVSSSLAASNYGADKALRIDRNTMMPGFERTNEALVRIVLDSIPDDAVVSEALLVLSCTKVAATIVVSYVGGTWQEQTVNALNQPTKGSRVGSVSAEPPSSLVVDLTPAVDAWRSGSRMNYGVYLSPMGSDATECASSEADDTAQRPRLTITYTLP